VAGTTGAGGSAVAACDPAPVFKKYYCTLPGACHDAQGAAGGLDMVTAGWEKSLVGRRASSSSPTGLCGSVQTPYLIEGSSPARGLFLQKLDEDPPPCGALMPSLGGPMTPSDRACIQSWANALTAAGPAAGCDIKPLMGPTKYACTVAGACHDGSPATAAGLDMVNPGWEQRLIGQLPPGTNASMCGGVKTPYLIAGSRPAAGLFLQKLTQDPPPCGALMPTLGGPMSADDLQCFQRWADALTAAAAP
jgi:hypothetical protein